MIVSESGRETEAAQLLPRHGKGLAAMGADPPNQPLGHGPQEGGTDQEGLDTEVLKPGDGGNGVVGVQGGKDEVAGQGRLGSVARGVQVPYLADHDDVRVLPQYIT